MGTFCCCLFVPLFLFCFDLVFVVVVALFCFVLSACVTKNRPPIKEATKIKIFHSSGSFRCNDSIRCVDNTQHESLVNSSFFVVKLGLV